MYFRLWTYPSFYRGFRIFEIDFLSASADYPGGVTVKYELLSYSYRSGRTEKIKKTFVGSVARDSYTLPILLLCGWREPGVSGNYWPIRTINTGTSRLYIHVCASDIIRETLQWKEKKRKKQYSVEKGEYIIHSGGVILCVCICAVVSLPCYKPTSNGHFHPCRKAFG